MGAPELLALSLGLSLLLALFAYGLVRVVETTAPDPGLRERAWATALYLPALPVLLVASALLLPAPAVEQAFGSEPATVITVAEFLAPHGASFGPIGEGLAIAVLALAGLLMVMRAIRLAWRTVRLQLMVRASDAAPPALSRMVAEVARRQAMPTPKVRVRTRGSEALVTGLINPVLILPENLISEADPQALSAVCTHELAHLKRGDHRSVWVEEALLTILAVNPMLGIIRDHRSAAREEACDAAALAEADESLRRLYARSLLDALRASPRGDDAPALTFTSSRRSLVVHRLKAILSPVQTSGVRSRLAVLGLGVAVAAVAGTSSIALAGQRERVVSPQPAPNPVAFPASAPPAVATPAFPALAAPEAVQTSQVKSGPVSFPAAAAEPEPITNPGWAQPPLPSYPEAAIEQGLTSGRADLSCTAQADGRLSGCTIISEDPVGAGYGAAALEAAARARLSPRSIDSAAPGATVRFAVRFRLSAE